MLVPDAYKYQMCSVWWKPIKNVSFEGQQITLGSYCISRLISSHSAQIKQPKTKSETEVVAFPTVHIVNLSALDQILMTIPCVLGAIIFVLDYISQDARQCQVSTWPKGKGQHGVSISDHRITIILSESILKSQISNMVHSCGFTQTTYNWRRGKKRSTWSEDC